VDISRTVINFLSCKNKFMKTRVSIGGERCRVACVEKFCRLDFLFLAHLLAHPATGCLPCFKTKENTLFLENY
jgi:hypothetical protein